MEHYCTPWWGEVEKKKGSYDYTVRTNRKNCVGQSRLWHRVRIEYTKNTSARTINITKVAIQVTGAVQSKGKYPKKPPSDGGNIAEMRFSVTDTFDVYLNGTKVWNKGTLKYNWSKVSRPHTLGTKSVNKTYTYRDDGTISIPIKLYLKRTDLTGKSIYTTGHYLEINDTVNWDGDGNISPKINWEAPSINDFYYTAVPEMRYIEGRAKPEESIRITCGGLSGGKGNGAYKAYKVTMTTTRNSNTYIVRDETESSINTNLVPEKTYYAARPGDVLTFHYYGITKKSSGSKYNIVDNRTINITIEKDTFIWFKDGSGNQKDIIAAYYKDSSGNEKKLRYLYVKDSSGAQRVIDVYTKNYDHGNNDGP